MTIFLNLFVSKNGFLLTTHLFKTSWTPSLVATPPKSTMSRRSKGSKHGVFFVSFFRARFFCRARLCSSMFWTFLALKLLPFDPSWKILSNALLFISNGGQEPELWLVLCSRFSHELCCCTIIKRSCTGMHETRSVKTHCFSGRRSGLPEDTLCLLETHFVLRVAPRNYTDG